MNTASGACFRVASSRLSVPPALTSKSSNGRALARSCEGWAAQWMIRSGRVLADDPVHRLRGRGYPGRPMLESGAGLRPGGAGSRPYRPGARRSRPACYCRCRGREAAAVEMTDRLGADQAAAAGHEHLHRKQSSRTAEGGKGSSRMRPRTSTSGFPGQTSRTAATGVREARHRSNVSPGVQGSRAKAGRNVPVNGT